MTIDNYYLNWCVLCLSHKTWDHLFVHKFYPDRHGHDKCEFICDQCKTDFS